MAVQLFKNNVTTTLNGDLTNVATSIVVTDGSVFGTVASPNYMMLTLFSGSPENKWEIVKVTGITANTLTVTRAQDGTAGVSWSSGDRIGCRMNAGSIYAYGGAPTFTDLTVTNAIAGSVTGNAATVTNATFTTTLTNQGGAGVLAWPVGGATLTIPTDGGTLGTGAWATIASYATLATPVFTTNITTPLIIGGSSTTQTLTYKTTTGVGTTGADHIFQVGNNGATEAMRILNSGNVGIGTTAPAFALSVQRNDALSTNVAKFYNPNDNWAAASLITTSTWATDTQQAQFGFVSQATSANGVRGGFVVKTTTTGAGGLVERFRINTDGNVGIGTTAPVSIAEIQDGLTTVGAVLTLSSKETSTVVNDVLGQINFRAALDAAGGDAVLTGASIAAIAEGTFSATNNATTLTFQTGASEVATTKMTISSAGLVTIGTATQATVSAAGVLTVANTTASTTTATGALTVAGGIGVAGQVTSTTLGVGIGAMDSSILAYVYSAATAGPIVRFETQGAYTGISAGQLELRARNAGYGAGVRFTSKETGTNTYLIQAAIEAEGSVSWNSVANASSFLRFSTIAAGTLAERVRISSVGDTTFYSTTASTTTTTGCATFAGGIGVAGAITTTNITCTNAIAGSVTGNAATVTNATFTTAFTNQGGAGVLAWPGAGATLTIPTGGGTLGTAAFTAATAYLAAAGTAAKATVLETTRAINGVNFDGSAAITTPVNNANDTTNADYFVLFTSLAGGNYAALSNAGIKFHPSTGILTCTGFAGPLTGNVTGNTDTVTTNANLSGHVTSVGNATSLGSFTLAQLNTAVSDADVAPIASPTFTGTVTIPTGASITTPTITKPVMNATNPTAQTYTPAGAGTATLDCSLANQHDITMPAGNITIALSNITLNQCIMVSITQDGTGSRTVTWFSTIRWAGGSAPTLTTTASKRDVVGFRRTGTNTYDGFVIGQNI